MLDIQKNSFSNKYFLLLLVIIPISLLITLLFSQGYILITVGFVLFGCICIMLKSIENLFLFWLLLSPLVMSDSFSFLTIDTHPILTFDRILIIIIFIILLIQTSLKIKKLLPVNKLEIAMMLLFLIIITSIIVNSENKFRAARVFTDGFLIPFIIYFLAKNLITNDKYFKKFLNVFIIISIYLSSIGIFEYFTRIDLFPTKVGLPIRAGWIRVTGPYINDAGFAIILTLCFFMVLYKYIIEYLKKNKNSIFLIFYTTTLCLVLISIALTFLRAAWLSLVFALFVWILIRRKGLIKLIIIIPLILLITFFSYDYIKSTSIYKNKVTNIGTVEGRLNLWDNAFSFFKKNPIFGIGFKNFYYRGNYSLFTINYIHNTFMSFLTETGIIGFGTIIIIIMIILKQAYRYYVKSAHESDKEFSIIFICILICYFLPWMSDNVGYFPEVNKLFFVILGVALGRSEQNLNY